MSKKVQNVITAGIVFVVFGAAMRINATDWAMSSLASSKEDLISSLSGFDRRHQLLSEGGAWSLGFGLAIIAATVGAWSSRD